MPTNIAPSRATPRIAVIGGGISGLAAAHRLTELLPHAEVKLMEASERLGGVLDTVHTAGYLIERSADNFLTQPTAAADLCRRLGIADHLLPTDDRRRRAFVVKGGKLLPIPDGFYLMSPRKLKPLLTSPLLSWPGKLRLLAEPFVPRQKPGDADESVAAFACRRLGREAYERLIQPLVAGIYTADPDQLSMAATMPQFVEMERQRGGLLRATLRMPWTTKPQRIDGAVSADGRVESADAAREASGARYGLFAAPRGGMSCLVNALVGALPNGTIQTGTPVMSLSREPNNLWSVNFGSPAAAGNPQSFDAVIIATPSHAAATLVAQCAPELAAELAAISYAGCAVVSFGFTRQQIGQEFKGFGFVVPQVEGRQIIAASFASQKFPDRAPTDCVLIRVFIGGALRPELVHKPDAELRQLALGELASLLQIRGEPLITDVARWPMSMPQYHVGHLGRVARIEQLVAKWPGLALAGNAYRGVGIPQCIQSGELAAERVVRVVVGNSSGDT